MKIGSPIYPLSPPQPSSALLSPPQPPSLPISSPKTPPQPSTLTNPIKDPARRPVYPVWSCHILFSRRKDRGFSEIQDLSAQKYVWGLIKMLLLHRFRGGSHIDQCSVYCVLYTLCIGSWLLHVTVGCFEKYQRTPQGIPMLHRTHCALCTNCLMCAKHVYWTMCRERTQWQIS